MFGYVTAAPSGLSDTEQIRYRAAYCGLCRKLGERYGAVGRMTLSYDMTFLYLLLSSLYEPNESLISRHCLPHAIHKHSEMMNDLAEYCADMNILLSYHKAMDDWKDDKNYSALLLIKKLSGSYQQLCERYQRQSKSIINNLTKIEAIEQDEHASVDDGANATAALLGDIYRYHDDEWGAVLQVIGEGLGRFIYLMDAYDDLAKDIKAKRYNPLISIKDQESFEALVKQTLTLYIAESTDAFEILPLEKDLHLLRNILYAGCWSKYEAIQKKKSQRNGLITQKR